MTKEEVLKWRLGERPTVEGIAKLVEKSILTKEEAKQIVFSSETETDRSKKSYQSEIKFLRELIQKLSNNSNSRIVEVIREIEKPVYVERYPWYRPYQYWWSGDTTLLCKNDYASSTGISDITTMATCASSADVSASSNFSDINTFN